MDNYSQDFLQIIPGITQMPFVYKDESPVNCLICGSEFQNIRGLRLHEGRVHSLVEKNTQCSQCCRLFKNKYSLRIHVKQVHDRATRETCQKCSKVLYNKYMLKKHIKKVHPAEAEIG